MLSSGQDKVPPLTVTAPRDSPAARLLRQGDGGNRPSAGPQATAVRAALLRTSPTGDGGNRLSSGDSGSSGASPHISDRTAWSRIRHQTHSCRGQPLHYACRKVERFGQGRTTNVNNPGRSLPWQRLREEKKDEKKRRGVLQQSDTAGVLIRLLRDQSHIPDTLLRDRKHSITLRMCVMRMSVCVNMALLRTT